MRTFTGKMPGPRVSASIKHRPYRKNPSVWTHCLGNKTPSKIAADLVRSPEIFQILSSQRTVGGSKIDTNRGLLCHDELSSKNWKRMRVLRVTFQLEQMPGQFDLRSILIHKSIVLAMSIAMLWSFPHMSPYVSLHLRLCLRKGYLPNWFVYHHFPMKLAIGRYPPLTNPSNGSHRLSGWWF